MASHEVWNFVSKFYNLCNTGKNATLTLKSQHKKAVINLQLDLCDLPPPHHLLARSILVLHVPDALNAVLKLGLKHQLKMLLVSL